MKVEPCLIFDGQVPLFIAHVRYSILSRSNELPPKESMDEETYKKRILAYILADIGDEISGAVMYPHYQSIKQKVADYLEIENNNDFFYNKRKNIKSEQSEIFPRCYVWHLAGMARKPPLFEKAWLPWLNCLTANLHAIQ